MNSSQRSFTSISFSVGDFIIMRYRYTFLIISSLLFFSCGSDKDIYEFILVSPIQKGIIEHQCKDYIIVSKSNFYKIDLSKENFLKLLRNLNLLIELTMDKLNNYNTTRTANGEPYKETRVIICDNLNLEMKEESEENSMYHYVYKPSHPDAINAGALKGYVAYPDINPELESTLLVEYITLYKMLIDKLIKKYPDIGCNIEIYDYYMEKYINKEYLY
ncbi:MAG: hypothetical protein PQJ46_10200 [Spirochaetales bacterium]|nr:hypothetical protein [Spirochaetales bacterium]